MSHLTEKQRYAIEQLKAKGMSQKEIAAIIGKDKSVVCRELKRNSDGRSGKYNSDLAQRKYTTRLREKPKHKKLTIEVKDTIKQFLEDKYSPEQIVGYCKKQGIKMVSVERIYQHIWLDKKQHGNLHEHLRTRGKRYRKRGNSKDSRGIIKNRIDIDHRPKIVELKQRVGDLEIDTIIGKNHQGAIVTINDRATGMLKMKKIYSKDANELAVATIELLQPWKPYLHTITADNGKEFAQHESISKALNINFFFAKPYHSWERGANENLNGLIRQYIPKKSNLSTITNEQISWIEKKLNDRPRKRFNFESPNQIFNQKVAFVT